MKVCLYFVFWVSALLLEVYILSPEANPSSSSLPFLPFSKPTFGPEEHSALSDCLTSGWVATGPKVQAFEAALVSYCSSKDALKTPEAYALTSGTAGLYLALKALDLSPGDEVITTPFTFVATLNTIELAGGTPVLVDIDPDTYNLDLDHVAKKISEKTRAILPIHFAGLPVDMDVLFSLTEGTSIQIIEDAAHAIGSSYKGKKIGGFGHAQVFSFHPNKNMTTIEGGAVMVHSPLYGQSLTTGRFHGIDRSIWNRFSKTGSQVYDVITPAHKFNMPDLHGTLGCVQLKQLDGFIERRTFLVDRYKKALQDLPSLILPPFPPSLDFGHSWHLFAPRINTSETSLTRDDLITQMKKHGIGVGLHYIPSHLYTYYATTYGYKRGDFPHAEAVGDTIFSLPLFPLMTNDDQHRVIKALYSIFHGHA